MGLNKKDRQVIKKITQVLSENLDDKEFEVMLNLFDSGTLIEESIEKVGKKRCPHVFCSPDNKYNKIEKG